ncbi:MAG: hypothetical protein UY41_C0002G0020 [Candidatus Moranbacteria bacterium GW2011_GWE1_49_15]|nr:MAG: hypothetical protein UX75_C0003G0019 [Candidatus Moranbacteria bacterium GW2011_GWE2_47_10]KKW07503.1 MAG: hypothetical protein UY41_C0002G0020 [Candidatus Moranbacteria bacterium GW2011_GWE1_49_15]HBP01281.1 hypothetical protein [Candidatus Moranbacteria bacterium]
MKGKIVKITAGLLVLAGIVLATWKDPKIFDFGDQHRQTVVLSGREFEVEIADTHEKSLLGLGGREGMCEYCGMLFTFPEKARHAFWMKGMRFDLDIIWVADGKAVWIEKKIPFDSGETFDPDVVSDQVLELNAGLADGIGIAVGDRIDSR